MKSDTARIATLLLHTEFFGPAFQALPENDILSCAAFFHPVQFDAGQLLFSRGDTGDHLMMIASGRVRLSLMNEDGRELSVRHAIEGQLIGEIAVLDDRRRSAEALALTPVEAFTLSRDGLHRLQAQHSCISAGIIAFLCKRLRDTTDQMEAIALYPVEARLARFLLVSLNGRRAEQGKRLPLELGFSQTELAQLLGASRPKVNTALRLLEEMGAVRRTADRLFCAPDILAHVAGVVDDT